MRTTSPPGGRRCGTKYLTPLILLRGWVRVVVRVRVRFSVRVRVRFSVSKKEIEKMC